MSLAKTEQRKSGFRGPSVFACRAVSVLGLREVTTETVHLPQLVEGQAHASCTRLLGKPLARTHGFRERFGPDAMDLQDFGSPHEARSSVRHQLRLRIAPPSERRRPLLRPL